MRRVLFVILAFSLVACKPGMANQGGTTLEASIGTLTWGRDGPTGTAVLVASGLPPESPYGPRGSSYKLYPPRQWNNGEPISLSARWLLIVRDGPREYYVGWYLWPDRPPIIGDYTVETVLGGQIVRRTVRLTDLDSLPLSRTVRVDRIRQDDVVASWSPVAGARLYGAAIETSAAGFAPRDVAWGYHKTYTAEPSASIPRVTGGNKPYVNRVAVYAFTADFTRIPIQVPAHFNVSWTLSEPFEFQPGP